MQATLSLGPYDLADVIVLEMLVADKGTVWGLQWASIGGS